VTDYQNPNPYRTSLAYEGTTGAGGPTAQLVVTPDSGATVPFVVSADASGSLPGGAAIATYEFDWGDGTPNTGPQAGATAPHTYTVLGTFVVTVTVTDAASGVGVATAVVTIGDTTPEPPDPPPIFQSTTRPTWTLVDPRPPCIVDRVYGVQLSWTQPSLAAGDVFIAYLLERADDTSGYHLIRRITDQGITSLVHFEARDNVSATYRLRTETDAGLSIYSNVVAAVLPGCCGFAFVSDVDPTLNMRRRDLSSDGDREIEWISNDTELELYGRDSAVVFRELEDRGDAFEVELLLWAESGTPTARPPGSGAQAWEVARRLVRTQVPYVCVKDENGSRWYAAISPAPGGSRRAGRMYEAKLRVREVTSAPFPADALAAV
jgi:hypothetical protein